MVPRRFEPVDDLDETLGEVGLVDFAGGLRLPGRVDLDELVEIDRQGMPGHLRLVGQQGRRDAGLAQQGGQRRPRLGRRRTHRVPPLPVRAVQSLQLRRVDQGLIEDHRLAGQAGPGPASRSTSCRTPRRSPRAAGRRQGRWHSCRDCSGRSGGAEEAEPCATRASSWPDCLHKPWHAANYAKIAYGSSGRHCRNRGLDLGLVVFLLRAGCWAAAWPCCWRARASACRFFKIELGPLPLTADRLLLVLLVGQYLFWRRWGWPIRNRWAGRRSSCSCSPR